MRRLALLTSVLVLSAPAVADAATTFVLQGRGFGHGVGMSQYGAYGLAQHGWSYRSILGHYYTGAQLGSAPTRRVRVLLQPIDPYIRVSGATWLGKRRIDPAAVYVARPAGIGIVVRRAGGGRVGRFGGRVFFGRNGRPLRLLGPALNGISDGRYRGRIEVVRHGGGVTAVNALPMDAYVRGVVAGEVPSSWHREVLKSQAVAARSYALATRRSGAIFDQYPDTRSQVYKGVRAETAATNAAVRATSREVLVYGGEPVVTYYFSTSGGHTENVENSFLGASPRPYLKGVPDPYDTISPHHDWRLRFSPTALARQLGVLGAVQRIQVLERGVTPRVVRARVVGTVNSRALTGPQIRARLGLKDTWLQFAKVSSSTVAARGALLGSALPRRALVGEFQPAPRRRLLVLERRTGRRWVRVRSVRTSRRGGFSAELPRRGLYRVRSGEVAGPAVRG